MRLRGLLALPLLLSLVLNAPAREKAGKPTYYEVTGMRHFKVVHSTALTIPPGVEILRVYHGIPDPAAWAGGGFRAERTVLTPYGCQVHDDKANGPSWLWEQRPPLASQQTFQSSFDLASADRRLRTENIKLAWSDFFAPLPPGPSPAGVEALAAVVREDTPIPSLVALSAWIYRNSTYDASVIHDATDVASTLRVGRGQCGHHAALFAAVMKIWGIPCRIVSGFRLAPTSELWTEQNDWNRHAWIEVMLPGVGWVEVEPRSGNDPFFQPAELIRNSGVQSQVSWIRKDGQWSILESYQDRLVGK